MSLEFDKYANKGNEFINRVADQLKVPKDKAGRIVRAVFHALRNRLSIEESFQLMAQLPMALKAVYVDGWKYKKKTERIKSREEFFDEIRKEDSTLAGYDFGNNQRAELAVLAVFATLSGYITEGELKDISGSLPADLKLLFEEGTRKVVISL